MTKNSLLTDEEVALRRRRFEEAIHLQKMENNPLDNEQIAMFEMFERDNFSDEECLNYMIERAQKRAESQ
ncbi:hypothetical protein [Celeribacter sp.]|uniref:hypothetical protein n=1 Tax=Celeribacter sp. TaxID=1890673 RepID=UPI003A8D7309